MMRVRTEIEVSSWGSRLNAIDSFMDRIGGFRARQRQGAPRWGIAVIKA
jgi:hypothetical protein